MLMLSKFQLILLIFIAWNCLIFGQTKNLADIRVIQDGVVMTNGFIGGFDAPQFGKADLNNDGESDLIVLDREGGVAKTFLFDATSKELSYTYAPRFQENLPHMSKWMRIIDYNNDGISDIFTSPDEQFLVAGIQVYTGYYDNDELKFDLFEFSYGDYDILYIFLTSNWVNIYSAPSNLPSIVDVDGDGDVDVLTFSPSTTTVEYYRNMVVEKGLGLDTFDFVREDECFGKFVESGFSEEISLSDDPENCASYGLHGEMVSDLRHGAGTVEALDHDNDGDLDLLIGDSGSNRIIFLENGGTAEKAFMVLDSTGFPWYDVPVEMPIFINPSFIDVNNDGKRDLLAAPNNENSIENINNIWYYENVGEDNAPIFEFRQDDFLQNEIVDLGSDAAPIFLDYNQDGLIDILVGTSGQYVEFDNDEMRLVLYENIGSIGEPIYELREKDYLGFSVNKMVTKTPAPAIGDLDGDGDDDLLVGDLSGVLYYFENIAGPGMPYAFANPVYKYFDIDPGQEAKPTIMDFNQDGLNDIVIGEKSLNQINVTIGNVNYYENYGTQGNPEFVSKIDTLNNNAVFGAINTRSENAPGVGSAAPKAYWTGEDYMIICGSQHKGLIIYENVLENYPGGAFDENLVELDYINEGEHTTPDVADIDNDGYLEIIVGCNRGGFAIYNSIIRVDGVITEVKEEGLTHNGIDTYPNPVIDEIYLNTFEEFSSCQIFTMDGRLVLDAKLNTNVVNVRSLSEGMYVMKLKSDRLQISNKFLKINK